MTLAEARKASEALRIFLQEKQTEHSELRDFMGGVESLSRVIEEMSLSARSKQTRMTDYFSREPASGGAPGYRRSDFVNFPWIVNIVVLPEWFTKYEDLL